MSLQLYQCILLYCILIHLYELYKPESLENVDFPEFNFIVCVDKLPVDKMTVKIARTGKMPVSSGDCRQSTCLIYLHFIEHRCLDKRGFHFISFVSMSVVLYNVRFC